MFIQSQDKKMGGSQGASLDPINLFLSMFKYTTKNGRIGKHYG